MDLSSIDPSLMFAAKAGGSAGLVVILDWCIFRASGNSYLHIPHEQRWATPAQIGIWVIGASIVAWFGTLIEFFRETPQSIGLIALTWHGFFKQIQNFVKTSAESDQPPEVP